MYLDSAVLVKLVVREPDSLFYAGQVDGQAGVWTSQLALTECWSALFRKQREGAIDAKARRSAWRKLEQYVADGALDLVPVDRSVLRRANQIIERCHPKVPVRSLDAIHLASCEATNAFPLLTNDERMRAAARRLRFALGPMP
jgi:uncharacterized protein